MKFTSVRELKAKTSEMLRTVERGNTVIVTTHGRPTAMLVPVTEDDIEDALACVRWYCLRWRRTLRLADYKATRVKKKVRTA